MPNAWLDAQLRRDQQLRALLSADALTQRQDQLGLYGWERFDQLPRGETSLHVSADGLLDDPDDFEWA